MKRGQITIFVILGVALIVGASLFVVFNETSASKKEDVPIEFTDIYNFIDSCMDQAS